MNVDGWMDGWMGLDTINCVQQIANAPPDPTLILVHLQQFYCTKPCIVDADVINFVQLIAMLLIVDCATVLYCSGSRCN